MRSLFLVLLAVSLCASTSTAQATLVHWHALFGSPYHSRRPSQFRSISDLDGDGRRDFLFRTGARCWAESSRDIREVIRWYSPAPVPHVYLRNVAPIADMDGDGVEEVVLTLARVPQLLGGVRVLSGLTGAPILSFTSPLGETSTATRAESAGDVDGDGVTDLAVEFEESTSSQRFVRIHSGASGAPIYSYAGREWFQVQAIGDLNGDSHADLLVGGAGAARIHSGADNTILRDLTVPSPGPQFGVVVRLGCDHDGDGFADPVVVSGTTLMLRWNIFSSASGQLLYTIDPQSPSGEPLFPFDFATCCGDVDHDGVADYTMRASSQVSWPICSTVTSQHIGQVWSLLGAIDDLGDINGDGFADLGAAMPDAAHGYSFHAAVLLGQPAPVVSCTPTPPPGVDAFVHYLSGGTSLSVGDQLVSIAECAPHGSRALFAVGTAAVANPIGLTTLCVGERRALFASERIDAGWNACDHHFEHRWSRERLAALGVAPGDTLYAQFVLLDPSAPSNARIRTSNAVAITFAP